jgi:xanthine dehydrogenase YagT iron-sulfur-binding subunit
MALEQIPTEPTHENRRPGALSVELCVNGTRHGLEIDPRVTLLDALRERLRLPGAKKGCDHMGWRRSA